MSRGISILLLGLVSLVHGGNPLVPHTGMADPHVHVFDGRIYMYATHDTRSAPECCMGAWWIWSSDDLITWKNETLLPNFLWTPSDLANEHWATDGAQRNGRFYWYVSVGGRTVGVVRSETPTGPWEDPLGKPLLPPELGDRLVPPTNIRDPGVLQDDDGRYYIVFGACGGSDQPNDSCYYLAELLDDMISYRQPVHLSVQGALGPYGPGKADDKPFLHKYAGVYYLSWGVFYATATTPYGPYRYRGVIINPLLIEPSFRVGNLSQQPWYTQGDYSDRHGSFVVLNGQCYFFCNDYSHSDTPGFRGTVAAYVHYRADGSIAPIIINEQGVGSHDVSITAEVPAEHFFAIDGAQKQESSEGGFEVAGLSSGSVLWYANIRNVQRGDVPWLRFANGGPCIGEAALMLGRFGAASPKPIGHCRLEPTGSWQSYMETPCELDSAIPPDGADLLLRFQGCDSEFARLDLIRFSPLPLKSMNVWF